MLIFGFIRERFQHLNIPTDVKRMISQFYPMFIAFIGTKMGLTMEEKMHLTEYLIKLLCSEPNNELSSELLYGGARDGLGAEQWHDKVDGHKNTLSIVQTEYDHIFGCFASEPFDKLKSDHFPDIKSFLCVIRTQFKDAECPKFAPFVGRKDGHHDEFYYGPYTGACYGPTFGWAFDLCVFAYEQSSGYVNHNKYSRYPNLFGNELCGGKIFDSKDRDLPLKDREGKEHDFTIKALETFELIIE